MIGTDEGRGIGQIKNVPYRLGTSLKVPPFLPHGKPWGSIGWLCLRSTGYLDGRGDPPKKSEQAMGMAIELLFSSSLVVCMNRCFTIFFFVNFFVLHVFGLSTSSRAGWDLTEIATPHGNVACDMMWIPEVMLWKYRFI